MGKEESTNETPEEMDRRIEKMIEEGSGTLIKGCSRCGGEHRLEFKELEGECIDALIGEYSHFAICPTTGQPIVQMRQIQRDLHDNIDPFKKQLARIINQFNMDSFTNTPDFLLAEHLMHSIGRLARLNKDRDGWHRKDRPVEPWSENELKKKED